MATIKYPNASSSPPSPPTIARILLVLVVALAAAAAAATGRAEALSSFLPSSPSSHLSLSGRTAAMTLAAPLILGGVGGGGGSYWGVAADDDDEDDEVEVEDEDAEEEDNVEEEIPPEVIERLRKQAEAKAAKEAAAKAKFEKIKQKAAEKKARKEAEAAAKKAAKEEKKKKKKSKPLEKEAEEKQAAADEKKTEDAAAIEEPTDEDAATKEEGKGDKVKEEKPEEPEKTAEAEAEAEAPPATDDEPAAGGKEKKKEPDEEKSTETKKKKKAGETVMDAISKPIELTFKNFDDALTHNMMPWVVVYTEEEGAPESALNLAKDLDSFARIGYVNTAKEKALLKFQKIDPEEPPAFRVYNFGVPEEKEEFRDVLNVAQAEEVVRTNLPKDLVFKADSMQAVQPFLQQAVSDETLPVLFMLKKPGVPEVVTKCAMWFADHFSFAVVTDPPKEFLDQFQVTKIPDLMILAPQPSQSEDGQMGLSKVAYDRKRWGGIKFKFLFKFLTVTQMEFAQMGIFKGWNEKGNKRYAKEDTANVEPGEIVEMAPDNEACADGKLGLCVIAFLDGAAPEEDREAKIKMLEEVQFSPVNRGRPLSFMWADATCRPDFAAAFDVDPSVVPALVAVQRKKGKFAKHLGAFNTAGAKSFVAKVLGGKQRLVPYSEFPTMEEADCAAKHAEMAGPAAVEEDDIDMDELMAEIRAEEEAAEAEGEAAATDAADDELKAKEERARKEMEKLMAKSNQKKGGKGKKKKKKKKKGKKGKKKTEL